MAYSFFGLGLAFKIAQLEADLMPRRYVEWTPSLDTSVLAAGDIAAATEVITNMTSATDTNSNLVAVTMVDKSDQSYDLDLWLMKSNVSIGTENAAPSISDTDMEQLLGCCQFFTSEFKDLGGARFCRWDAGPIECAPISGTRSLAAALVLRSGTPTFLASSMVFRFWFDDN